VKNGGIQTMKKMFVLLAVILFTAVLRGGGIQETIEIAAKVSDGIETGIEQVAKNNPETFQNVLGNIVLPFQILVGVSVVLFAWPLFKLLRRLCCFRKAESQAQNVTPQTETDKSTP
jgi:hypothetical protein